MTWKGDSVVRMEPVGNDPRTGYSDFDKAEKDVYYGPAGHGPLCQRDHMLADIQPSGADIHLGDGTLDFWKIK